MVDLAAQYADGRLHSSYKQDGTDTQRYSSSGPNLQNLPASERLPLPWLEGLPDIRASFVAPPGFRIVERDLSQIELRLAAHYSADPGLVRVYREGGDVHALTMAKLGVDRRNAKIGNFSVCYGISPASLAVKVSMATNVWPPDVRAAEAFIDGFLNDGYPAVRDMQDDLVARAEEMGYTEAITGYKFLLPPSEWAGRRRDGTKRKAVNYVIQGSAGGIIKWVMAELYELWQARGVLESKVWLIGQVHDSLMVRTTEDYAEQVNSDMEWAMEQAGIHFGLLVPLTSGGGIGASWSETK
jgi:DNA polymerase-1